MNSEVKKKSAIYTASGIKDFLNSEGGCFKRGGLPFTAQDVQGYIRRGKLPNYIMGGILIKEVKSRVKGVRVYSLEK